MTGPKIKLIVEKGIPVKKSKHPFDEMEVGDSFWCGDTDSEGKSARVAASRRASLTGEVYTVRKHEGGYRCWRIA